MALCFAYRSNSTTQARYAKAFRNLTRFKTATALTLTSGPTGTFGGTYLNVNVGGSTAPQVSFPGLHNTPIGTSAITVLMRLIPRASGAPAAKKALMYMGNVAGRSDGWYGGLAFNIDTNGRLEVDGGTIASGINWGNDTEFTSALTFVQDQPIDVWFVWDGSTSANSMKLYTAQHGNAPTLLASLTPSAARPAMQLGWVTEIQLNGNMPNGTNYNDQFHINEICIWDSAEDPTTYGARSDFITCDEYEGYSYTDPGQANVREGTGYTYNGLAKTGTAKIAAAATTKIGVAADDGTGTYDATERYTDFGNENIRAGEVGKYNSTTNNRTGELNNVTNVTARAILKGQSTSAVLREST